MFTVKILMAKDSINGDNVNYYEIIDEEKKRNV